MAEAPKNAHFWKDDESALMLSLLKELNILKYMDGRKTRNGNLFRKVAEQMKDGGFTRTPEQIRIRWKHLKRIYYQARPCPFGDTLQELLGPRPLSLSQVDCHGVDTGLQSPLEAEMKEEAADGSTEETDTETASRPQTPMNSKETEEFVKLRVSNNNLFSGRRNSSMWAWRAILRHMGLQQKMTHSQASKKWENLKKRYEFQFFFLILPSFIAKFDRFPLFHDCFCVPPQELKNPPDGEKVVPEMWPYFSLMDNAMEGRLEGNTPIFKALPNDKSKVSTVTKSSTASLAGEPQIEVSLNSAEDGVEDVVREVSQEIDCIMQEMERERNTVDSERKVMERERLVLQRERAVLDRESAALDRDRASLERERALMDREKAVMERERAMVEKDRGAVCSERLALEREKARLERLSAMKDRTQEVTEDSGEVKDSDVMDRKERLLLLFEKLLETF